MFYVLCRWLVPDWERWEPRLGSLVKRGEPWPIFDTEIVLSSMVWVPHMIVIYLLH